MNGPEEKSAVWKPGGTALSCSLHFSEQMNQGNYVHGSQSESFCSAVSCTIATHYT